MFLLTERYSLKTVTYWVKTVSYGMWGYFASEEKKNMQMRCPRAAESLHKQFQ